jgi:crossover junction endodeoxyribonuclease RuvC
MRVMGIDCGSEYTGYGVVEELPDRRLLCYAVGAIKLRQRDSMAAKLQQIFSELTHIIAEHRPEVVAIEDVFYAINVKSALKLGQVRGVAMLAASSCGLEVAEYSPLSIKSAVVGYGRADKQQMQQMVMRLLNLPAPPQPADAADALGIAICHIHTATTLKRYHRPKPKEVTS